MGSAPPGRGAGPRETGLQAFADRNDLGEARPFRSPRSSVVGGRPV